MHKANEAGKGVAAPIGGGELFPQLGTQGGVGGAALPPGDKGAVGVARSDTMGAIYSLGHVEGFGRTVAVKRGGESKLSKGEPLETPKALGKEMLIVPQLLKRGGVYLLVLESLALSRGASTAWTRWHRLGLMPLLRGRRTNVLRSRKSSRSSTMPRPEKLLVLVKRQQLRHVSLLSSRSGWRWLGSEQTRRPSWRLRLELQRPQLQRLYTRREFPWIRRRWTCRHRSSLLYQGTRVALWLIKRPMAPRDGGGVCSNGGSTPRRTQF